MWKQIFSIAVLFTASLSGCTPASEETSSPFIQVENGKFIRNGSPYYYIGANFWYGAILASEGTGGNRERLHRELDSLKAIGVDNLRILVGSDGKRGVPTKVEPTLQEAPGIYNDTILAGLDYLLAEMEKRDMVAVLYLNNSWEWSGGYSQYLAWAKLNAVNDRAQIVPIDPNKDYSQGVNVNGVTVWNWYDDVTNVKVANAGTKTPRASIQDPNDNDRISDRYIEDGSYIRLKNITLGYTFPSKLINKWGLDNLRIYANIQNLLTITGYDGYDPEIGTSTASPNVYGLDNGRYPSPTVYSFGLNISF